MTVPATEPTPATNPWGEDFDAERAWTLVQKLRADKAKFQEERDEALQAKTAADAALKVAQEETATAKTELTKFQRDSSREKILREFDIDDELGKEWLAGEFDDDTLRAKAEKLAALLGKGKKTEEPVAPPAEDAAPTESSEDEPAVAPVTQLPTRPRPAPVPGNGADNVNTQPDIAAMAARIAARQ